MAWEIIEHTGSFGDYRIWRRKDDEGLYEYAATRCRHGVAVEPSGARTYTQIKFARRAVAEEQGFTVAQCANCGRDLTSSADYDGLCGDCGYSRAQKTYLDDAE
jgi:DNA-directed RNA polymerase subunit RPC12/RpoP